MNVLFINACVRENSRTRRLCEEYIRKRLSGEDIFLRELRLDGEALLPFDREMLAEREADIAAGDYSSEKYRYAKEFAAADLLLIGAPYWDFQFPALLKVYFEHICVSGLTFRYDCGKPVSLCKAQELIMITTSGGYMMRSAEQYIHELSMLFGVRRVRFLKAEGLDIRGRDPEITLEKTISEM